MAAPPVQTQRWRKQTPPRENSYPKSIFEIDLRNLFTSESAGEQWGKFPNPISSRFSRDYSLFREAGTSDRFARFERGFICHYQVESASALNVFRTFRQSQTIRKTQANIDPAQASGSEWVSGLSGRHGVAGAILRMQTDPKNCYCFSGMFKNFRGCTEKSAGVGQAMGCSPTIRHRPAYLICERELLNLPATL